ncbi:hypothetical protein M9H77_00917 [Catharanthus roseus]|uniref:Uncharacterized protein n=1 Tax=Catharanthus roseus TaxID=4058 RepID=A0ACC0C475_CATRO|nr:hypothetical protein M9H77_00917 [Catharanthus roseus]
MSQLVNHVACIKSHHPRCEKFFHGPIRVPTHETYATPSTRHIPAANSRPWGHRHTITTEMLTGEAMSGQASTSKEQQKPPKPVENCSESLLLINIIICCCCFNKRECRSTE